MKDEPENSDNLIFLDQYLSTATKKTGFDLYDMIPDPTPREKVLIEIIEVMSDFIVHLSDSTTKEDLGFGKNTGGGGQVCSMDKNDKH